MIKFILQDNKMFSRFYLHFQWLQFKESILGIYFLYMTFLICYLTPPWPNLGLYQGDSLTH